MGFYSDIPTSTTNEASQVTVTGHRYLAGEEFASWQRRAAAFLIDVYPWVLLLIVVPALMKWIGLGHTWQTVATWLILAGLVGDMSGVGSGDPYQRTDGQKAMGIVVLRPIITPHGAHWVWTKPSTSVATMRIVLHALDTIFMFGFMRPLWNRHHATFADSLTACVVMRCADPATLDIEPAQRGVLVTKVQG